MWLRRCCQNCFFNVLFVLNLSGQIVTDAISGPPRRKMVETTTIGGLRAHTKCNGVTKIIALWFVGIEALNVGDIGSSFETSTKIGKYWFISSGYNSIRHNTRCQSCNSISCCKIVLRDLDRSNVLLLPVDAGIEDVVEDSSSLPRSSIVLFFTVVWTRRRDIPLFSAANGLAGISHGWKINGDEYDGCTLPIVLTLLSRYGCNGGGDWPQISPSEDYRYSVNDFWNLSSRQCKNFGGRSPTFLQWIYKKVILISTFPFGLSFLLILNQLEASIFWKYKL